MALSRMSLSRAAAYSSCLRLLACGDGVLKASQVREAPRSRQMSWFTGSGERPRRSQSRVLSSDDGHLFILESEFQIASGLDSLVGLVQII